MNWIDKIADIWDQMVPPPPRKSLSLHTGLDLDREIVFREKSFRRSAPPHTDPVAENEKLMSELRSEVARSMNHLRNLEDVIQRINKAKPSPCSSLPEIKIKEKMGAMPGAISPLARNDNIKITLR